MTADSDRSHFVVWLTLRNMYVLVSANGNSRVWAVYRDENVLSDVYTHTCI